MNSQEIHLPVSRVLGDIVEYLSRALGGCIPSTARCQQAAVSQQDYTRRELISDSLKGKFPRLEKNISHFCRCSKIRNQSECVTNFLGHDLVSPPRPSFGVLNWQSPLGQGCDWQPQPVLPVQVSATQLHVLEKILETDISQTGPWLAT